MNLLVNNYQNGNVNVRLYSDGSRIREFEDTPVYDFPCNIDVKITNWCDLSEVCTYCHESSNKQGAHGDLDKLKDILDPLPGGIELAIGGGNPLSHPDIKDFLYYCKNRNWVCNLTVNELHLKNYKVLMHDLSIRSLVKAYGISFRGKGSLDLRYLIGDDDENTVVHLIAGINTLKELDELIDQGCKKFLILGYKKDVGNGIDYYSKNQKDVDLNIKQWYMRLPLYFSDNLIFSFDNLAIEQLNVKRWFSDKEWEVFYQGNDFTNSMYIDAVKQEYAPTSRASKYERVSFNKMNLIDYFNTYKLQ